MEASNGQAVVDEALAPSGEKPPFSLELSQDQKDIRDWVHGFAEGVVRPAAAEWDEREETPWPVIQEAAKIGLYGFEAIAPTAGRVFSNVAMEALPRLETPSRARARRASSFSLPPSSQLPGTRQSSRMTSAVCEARMPCFLNFWPWRIPGVPGPTTKAA